ncbi:MAG: site-2 protease family protein [Actinomycetota bacterium]|nr:site-2 protease family protein [Actinomycetota bacterium]
MIRKNSFKIFRIAKIDIRIDYSWFVIFALIVYFFGFSYFPRVLPGTSIWLIIIITIISALLFFFSILFHEVSHSITSIRKGIPVKQITLFIFGGIAQIENEPDTPAKEFQISIAGPAASYFLAIVFGAVWALSRQVPAIMEPAKYLTIINIALGTFNLLPGFPLDGGRVLRSIIWKFTNNFEKATIIASNIGRGIGFAMIAVGIVYIFLGAFFNGVWLIFIGWFLQSAAAQTYSQVALERSIKGIKVKDVITTEIIAVSKDITVRELIDDWFLKYKYGKFPVIDKNNNDRYIGIITLNDIKELPRDKWDITTVGEIVNTYIEEDKVEMDTELYEAVKKINTGNISALVVIKNGRLEGLLTKTDIMQFVRIKSEFKS